MADMNDVKRIKRLCQICINCINTKTNYFVVGNVKYWAQYTSTGNMKDAVTPAQMKDDEKQNVIKFFQDFLDNCDDAKMLEFIEHKYEEYVLNGKDFEYIRNFWKSFCNDKVRLVVTYDEKIRKQFDLPMKCGLNAVLNGKEVREDNHYELLCEWSNDDIDVFLNHFDLFSQHREKECIYWKDFKQVRRKIKDVTRFGKHYFNVKTISELKKISIVGDKNIWGTLEFSGDNCFLRGDASNIWGDVSQMYGNINPKLHGDVSGITGFIDNLVGNATGIKLHILEPLQEETNIVKLADGGCVVEKYKLISNEDNKTLMKVWNCLAHHTIGITKAERALFDKPVKCKPPFPVDKWGRYYEKYNDSMIRVWSINPADIMFAKDVNKCSTCFCINSGSAKWSLGMRCLIALNSVNPNLGVAFVIKKDSVKKMNQFNGIKFKWYEPEYAGFFQYTNDGVYPFYRYDNTFKSTYVNILADLDRDAIKPIYGHDGINIDHKRQEKLAYLETFIKDGYRWYRGDDNSFPLVNNYHDFTMEDVAKKGWDEDIKIAKEKEQALYEYLKKVKGE